MTQSDLSTKDQQRPLLLTVKQVAQLLGLGVRTVWRLASEGQLTPISIGRAKRWERRAVEEFIAARRAQAACLPQARMNDRD